MTLEEANEENEIIENTRCTLFYLKNKLTDFELPTSINEFRQKVQSLFHLESKNLDDIIFIYKYKTKENNKEKIIEVKTDNEYNIMLKKLNEKELKKNYVYIETDKVPTETSRENSETYEEEIEYLIECELKAAGERIKKSLTGGTELYPNCKKQDRICDKCLKVISGDMFKGVNDVRKKTYCEKCSYQYNFPMFIIH